MIRLLQTLRQDERGTSFVEMALMSPFLAVLMLGTVDASRGVAAKLKLQQAATRAIEMASAGGLNSTAFNNLQAEAATAAGVATSKVTVTYWLECDRVKQASYSGSCTSTQEIGRYASVSIVDTYSPWFSAALNGLTGNISSTINLEGKASVRVQ